MLRCCFGKRKDQITGTTAEDKEQLTKNVSKMGVQKSDLTFEGMFFFSLLCFPNFNF